MRAAIHVTGDAVLGAASATFALVAREAVSWWTKRQERQERRDQERRREFQTSLDGLSRVVHDLTTEVDTLREKLAGFEGVVSMLMDRWRI